MSCYHSVLADPAWSYNQPLVMRDGVKRSSASQYQTMTVEQICNLGNGCGVVAGHTVADVALLGLWITAPFLLAGIHARVCEAWGFTPRQIVPWVKGRLVAVPVDTNVSSPEYIGKLVIQPGMGYLTRVCVEYLILATRGKYTSRVQSHAENGLLLAEQDALIIAPKSNHSRKPKEAYALMERLFPGPRLELFARERREGWHAWGDELPAEI